MSDQEKDLKPTNVIDDDDPRWIADPCKTPCYECEQIDYCPMGGCCCPV